MKPEEIKSDFIERVKNHEVKILKDDGVYRHLLCKNPDSVFDHFEIITSPGYLFYVGDMGAFTFTRVNDMFTFFRRDELKINTGYWGEKCVAGVIREYSYETFKENVKDYFESFFPEETEGRKEEWERIKERIIETDACEHEYAAYQAVNEYSDPHQIFNDFWEATNTVKTYRFVWCCYALVWAIQQYDEMKKQEEVEV